MVNWSGVGERETERLGRRETGVGERKIGRETGIREIEREKKKDKRETGAGEKERAAESEPQIERKRDRDGRKKEERQ